jgi:hypothetical protein
MLLSTLRSEHANLALHAGLAKPMPSAISKLPTAVVVKGGKRMMASIRR